MFKFIDGYKEEHYDNEIMIRCGCGLESLSFGFMTVEHPEIPENCPVLSIVYQNTPMKTSRRVMKKKIRANIISLPIKEQICLLYKLLKGEINGGEGPVIGIGSNVLVINRIPGTQTLSPIVEFIGFASLKDYTKFCTTRGDDMRYIAWAIGLEEKEFKTFFTQFEKNVLKLIPDIKDIKLPVEDMMEETGTREPKE